jgi:hypothetical protein
LAVWKKCDPCKTFRGRTVKPGVGRECGKTRSLPCQAFSSLPKELIVNTDLCRRFREQSEKDLNFALAEGIDPKQEYLRIIGGQQPLPAATTPVQIQDDSTCQPSVLDSPVAPDLALLGSA